MFSKDCKILVVDDSHNIRQIIVENLKRLGFGSVDVASDGNEAYSKVITQFKTGAPYELILSDLNMPGPSGIEFLKQIREHADFKTLPFLLITTESEKGAVIEAAMAGVSAYIVKPFNIETLSTRLSEAYKKHNP